MIIPSKQLQVEQINSYISAHADIYNKFIVYGKCITNEDNPDNYLEIAIQTVDDNIADDDEALLDLFITIDEITDGLFDLIILNSKYITSNQLNEIMQGEIIYG